jgi:predicted ATPase/DNA-binding SARP family transcriptional activator/tetratricopeptide (TPR) repeat protein
MLEVRLLGTFDVKYKKKPINISSRPAQSLFAYLILSAGTAHRREKLAGMLWPDSLEETARDNLRHALWRMRKALESTSSTRFLQADDISISFKESSDYWLDVAELEKISDDASADELIAAFPNYQGELMPGFYEEWVVSEREHLSSIFEHHMARLISLLQEEKRWLDILDWAERWIKLGQKPEPAYRALMAAHAAKGDMSKVAATYERCVKSLKEFGIEPSEQTRTLYQKLKSGKEKFETGTTVLVREKRRELPKTNLPVPITSFIGREKAVEEIIKLLSKNRLVTLMGAGGMGKTRLAIQSSNKLVGKFRDGVWWIELVGLNDASLVPRVVAKAVNVREPPNQPLIETLAENLASKQILLVMDNCEHLISACAQLADRLLSECKNLKILATSREALDILGETVWHAPSLSLPDMQEGIGIKSLSKYESVRLFTERAEVLQPQFMLTEQNVLAVVQICRRLSGMPLAIELAAARIKMMTVDEIASRLNDRFSLLTSGNRTGLPRQQTLRAAIDWSHDLLTEPERILFRRLSIFAGGFRLNAAEAVCGFREIKQSEVLDLLGRLVDKSLVDVEADPVLNETRYRLLETIREYASVKLEEVGEAKEVRERHLEFFVTFATLAGKGINSKEQVTWFQRIEREVDNLRAAISWPIPAVQESEAKQRSMLKNQFLIVGSLDMFWESRYRHEITQSLQRLLAVDEFSSLTIEKAKALKVGGFLLWSLNRLSEARTFLEESIAMAEKLGHQLTVAWSLSYLGWTFDFLGEYDAAKASLERSVVIARSLGENAKHIAMQSLSLLGDIPYWQGNLLEARRLYEESIAFGREIRSTNMLTYPLRRLGYITLYEKNYSEAARLFSESMELNRQLGHLPGMTACLVAFAALQRTIGNLEVTAMLCGCVERLLQQISAPLFFIDTVEYDRSISELQRALDEKMLSAAWSKGRMMLLEQAIDFALEKTTL